MAVMVREAVETDISDIMDIWEEFMAFLRDTNKDYWKVENGYAAFSKFLLSACDDQDTLVAVAENESGQIIGFSLALIDTLPEWFESQRIGLIRYVAVLENNQSKGTGYKLATFVMDWFRSRGIKRVELYVMKGLKASDFWSKMGFEVFMDRRFIEI